MLFKLAGVEFEDERLTKEQFIKIKPDLPFGQVPVLYIDGCCLPQSATIERTLAKKFGLFGKEEYQQALVSAFCDQVADVVAAGQSAKRLNDEVKMQAFFLEDLPRHYALLERFAKEHGKGWIVGDSHTLADVRFYSHISNFSLLGKEKVEMALEHSPTLKSVMHKFAELPAIAKWLKERPQQ